MDEKIPKNTKIILMLGETGSGKSTTINSFLNQILDVNINSNFRYKIIFDQNDSAQSQTRLIQQYFINCQD